MKKPSSTQSDAPDRVDPRDEEPPKVLVHPPTVFLCCLIAGFLLRLIFGGVLPLPRVIADGVGGALLIAAVALFVSAVSFFAEEGEALRPGTPSRQLLTTGAYRFSRNPIYLAMVVFGAGFGVATVNPWVLITTFVSAAIFQFLVIGPEERYLSRRFPMEFEDYRKKVRRWV